MFGVLRDSNVLEQKVGIPKLNAQRKTGKDTFNLICNCWRQTNLTQRAELGRPESWIQTSDIWVFTICLPYLILNLALTWCTDTVKSLDHLFLKIKTLILSHWKELWDKMPIALQRSNIVTQFCLVLNKTFSESAHTHTLVGVLIPERKASIPHSQNNQSLQYRPPIPVFTLSK